MNLGFRLYFADKTVEVNAQDLVGTRQGEALTYETQVEGCQVTWQMAPCFQGTRVEMTVKSDRPLGISRMDSVVFTLEPKTKTDRVAFMGKRMCCSETRFMDEFGLDREYCTDCVGLFEDFVSPGTITAGIAPFENTFGAGVVKRADGSLQFFAKTEYTKAMSEECELRAESVLICEGMTMDELYQVYRDLLPQSSFPMPKLTGWNTWDYYLDRVRPEDIEENVAALKDMPFADQLGYIVIDDGWQTAWGDWTENEKFSCGLAHVAEKIREAGFIPGLWMAPIGVKADSTIFKDHPDWLLRDSDGSLHFEMDLYYIDPTNPEVEKFILDHYRYQYAAGYRLFKIDYVSPLLKIKEFYDKSVTAYSALRNLMLRIQEATGEDAVILGCSLPVQCGADIAPAMRIAVDIHNHFSHVKWIAQSLVWTWLYNNKVTRIDPDFLIVRGEETSPEPLQWEPERNDFVPPPLAEQTDDDCMKSHWRHGDQFNALEAETWANLVAISGGNLFLSDRMGALNELGIELIEQAMAAAGNEGRPHYQKSDLRLPSLWTNETHMLLINWEDEPCKKSVEVKGNVTAKKPFALEDGVLTVELKAHESFLARVQA